MVSLKELVNHVRSQYGRTATDCGIFNTKERNVGTRKCCLGELVMKGDRLTGRELVVDNHLGVQKTRLVAYYESTYSCAPYVWHFLHGRLCKN